VAILSVLQEPDPRLRQISLPVQEFGPSLDRLLADMIQTMHALQGIGLAAAQVNVQLRLFVMMVGETKSPKILSVINPEILWASPEKASHEEGCLSVDGVAAKVYRPARIRARYNDEKGQLHEREFHGIEATCFQHELDHLNGILFIDHLSALRRSLSFQKRQRVLAFSTSDTP
jgi:peptide deformylase